MSTVEPPEPWTAMSDEELRAALTGRGESPAEAELLLTQWRKGNEVAAVVIGNVLGDNAGG